MNREGGKFMTRVAMERDYLCVLVLRVLPALP